MESRKGDEMRIVEATDEKRLIVCRGAPGSGKSTLAKKLGQGGSVFASDDFFMINGEYHYDRDAIAHAHLWNQGRVRGAMKRGVSPIVVDNTNITWAEIVPYAKLARENGYAISYAEPDTPWKFDVDELTKRNTHGVPRDVIQNMVSKWQPTETLGMDKKASTDIDTHGFAASGRLTAEEQELFGILMNVVKEKTPGTTVRAVGGWVRDKLMGKQPHDIDLMVDDIGGPEFSQLVTESMGLSGPHVIRSNPEQSKNIETARMYIPLSSGNKLEIDVAKTRQDVYQEGSRIPTTVDATAEEDSSRRDLTINCLFYNINEDKIEDFTGKGLEDLRNRVIRTPLDPAKTFSDDPLRMMRAIRFASRYGWQVAPDVLDAMSSPELREKLKKKVSRERKGIELKGMLSGGYPEMAVQLLIDTGIFEDILRDATTESGRSGRLSSPSMDQNSKWHDLNWAEHTKALARGVARKYRGKDGDKVFQVMMSALLHDAGKLDSVSRQQKEDGTTTYHGHEDHSKEMAEEFMRFVKLEQFSKPVEGLVGAHMRPHALTRYDSNQSAVRRFVRQMAEIGVDWEDVVNLATADALAKERPVSEEDQAGYAKLLADGTLAAKNMPVGKAKGIKPVVGGQDIMAAFGIKEGPLVGQMTKAVKEMMDENPAITKDEAIAKLRETFKQENWLQQAVGATPVT